MSEVSIFDPYFIQTSNLSDKNELLGSTIRTARVIVFTAEASSPLGKAVPLSPTGDLTVFADVVKVGGVISAPGRTIKIFCRRLEFHAGSGGSGISVNGEAGSNGVALNSAATAGNDGQLNPTSIPATNGITGEDGANGGDGKPGGTIEIYCNVLVPFSDVDLNAEGGKGGNGAVGQEGGPGGRGFSGYPFERYDLGNGRMEDDYFGHRAYGGYGGCGGNGGNGGNGGPGGRIKLNFMRLGNPEGNCRIKLSTVGGFGGDGAQPGKGGKGGDGGIPDPTRGPRIGAEGGGGGTCGLPGHRGYSGLIGTAYLGIPLSIKEGSESRSFLSLYWDALYSPKTEDERVFLDRLMKSVTLFIPEKPRIGKPGEPFANPNEAAPAGKPGPGGVARSPSLLRNKQSPDKVPIYGKVTITAHKKLAYKDLADMADLDQLEMLFDYTRGRYLLTNMSSVSDDDVISLIDVVTWLVLLGESKDSKLLSSAAATLENLRNGNNIFGRNAKFAALGTLAEYKSDLKVMLELYAPVEQTANLLRSAENSLTERKLYLENVVSSQKILVDRLNEARAKRVADTKASLAQVRTLDAARLALADDMAQKLGDLTISISDKVQLTPADFVNLFSQLSFTNRDISHAVAGSVATSVSPSGVAAAGAMVVSQAIDVVTKAIENVPSDLGGSVNKKYTIRRMEYLSSTVKNLGGLKESRDGLLKADPTYEYRLLATRDQVESICSNFYESHPSAKAFSQLLDQYIDSVATRNEKVEQYNQLLADVLFLDGEIQKAQLQQNQAATSLQTSASPGLPAMARFATALRRHAQERCVYQLYMASRVFTTQSLQLYDVFANVLASLTSPSTPGEINSAALNTGLIDLISQDLERKQTQRTSPSEIGDRCRLTLTPETHSLLFKMLKSGEPGTFSILPPTPDTTVDQNPFARMADVRLTHIRCRAGGMVTSDGYQSIELTHPGIETFVTEDGQAVRLSHSTLTISRLYNTKTGVHTGNGALHKDHSMIGPFCEWIISIPSGTNKGLSLTALESLEIEFEGMSRPLAQPKPEVGAVGA